MADLFLIALAALPDDQEINRLLIRVILVGLAIIAISTGVLLVFWRSLGKESERGETRMGKKSIVLLIALSVVLFVLSFVAVQL